MSINSNLQLINVFSKGMNTDTSDAYIPNDLYRYAENLRFVTDDGSESGELKLIEGYDKIWSLDPSLKIVLTTSIRNLIVILANDKNNHAYVIGYNIDDKLSRIFAIIDDSQWETCSVVTRWEDDDNVKLYVADGKHPLMLFDITWKDEYILPTPYSNFEAVYLTGGGYVFGGFGEITKINGSLKPAIVLYVYVLYSKNGGRSNISPSTQPISLYSLIKGTDRGYMDNSYTNIGIRCTIKESLGENLYNKILVYRITYSYAGQEPTIDLIADDDLHSEYYTFEDTGAQPIESGISFAEFVGYDYIEVCPLYIESKNDYLFAGNFSYYRSPDILNYYNKWSAVNNVRYNFTLSIDEITDNHSSKKSLLRGETYRYGIVLYDKYGLKWPVKHINDITVPDVFDADGNFVNNNCPITISNGKIASRSVGINFCVSNLDKDKFPYYEIVRVPRTWDNRKTISQGIIGRTMHYNIDGYTGLGDHVYSGSNKHYPSGLISFGKVKGVEPLSNVSTPGNYYTYTTEDSKLLQFCSPEISYGNYINDILDLYSDNLKIEMLWEAQPSMTAESEIDGVTVQRFGEDGWGYTKQNGDIVVLQTEENLKYRHPDYADSIYNCYRITKGKIIETYPALNIVLIDPLKEILHRESKADFDINNGDIKIVDTAEFNSFSNNDDFTFMDTQTSVGNSLFVNWSVAQLEYDLSDNGNTSELKDAYTNQSLPLSGTTWYEELCPIGAGGRSLLVNIDGKDSILNDYGILDESELHSEDITFARIVRNNVTPYGDAKYSVYSSFGNYFKNDGGYHEVFDGDCFILYFYYNAVTTFDSGLFVNVPKLSTVYIVPVETTIDMNSDFGDSYKRLSKLYTDKKIRYIQDKAVSSLYDYTQNLDACMYNTAYSQEPTIKVSTSVDADDIKNNSFDYRIAHSMQKSNNERYDSWLLFKAADYIDVDTRYGEITNLRLFKDSLIFWLKDATGILSVNERTMLQDVNNTNIILGNGDVLQRYDYITTEYGMKDGLMCDAQSDAILYWWDSYRKDIISYPGGKQAIPLKRSKQVSRYITSSNEVEHPRLAYDIKYGEILASVVKQDEEYPIIYSELIQLFTSIYQTPFKHKININGDLILFDEYDMYKWNEKGVLLYPKLQYIINNNHTVTKVYDNVEFGMSNSFYYDKFYNSEQLDNGIDILKKEGGNSYQPLLFTFKTIGLESSIHKDITDREYDLRFAIPRANNAEYCDRMRGRTMWCELTSSSNSTDFSIQYIITKYRISWS